MSNDEYIDDLTSTMMLYLASWARSLALFYQSFVIFLDYPTNLPKEIKNEINEDYKEFQMIFEKIMDTPLDLTEMTDILSFSEKLTNFGIKEGKELCEQVSSIFGASFNLLKLSSNYLKYLQDSNVKFDSFNITYVLSIEQVILFITYIDSYIKDITCIIYKIRYRNSQQTQDELNKGIEKFLKNMPMAFKKRIKIIENKLKVKFQFKKEHFERINYYEQLRHIYVHNFGRIDQGFINKTNLTNLTVGEIIPISFYDVLELSNITWNIIRRIYLDVVNSCFTITSDVLDTLDEKDLLKSSLSQLMDLIEKNK